jgi:hypothetical protein
MAQNKIYSATDTLRTPARTLNPFPGLFYYSGFGWGDYYSTDGTVHWTPSSAAYAMAAEEGVKHVWVDSLENYQPVYLGD